MKPSIIAVLLLAVVSLEALRYRKDYSYYPEAGGWLKLHRVPAPWREARLRCHLEGGTLASPLTPALAQALQAAMRAHGITDCGIFTGIHATFSSGDFTSIEGTPLVRIAHRWAKGEPDNAGGAEQCLLLLPDGALADVRCDDAFPYACYHKKTPGQLLNVCGTFDNEYTLDARTGSCYKLHTVARTWSRAYMACAAEGAHLAVINSVTEATALRELFARFPAHKIPTRAAFGKDIVFIGFQDWGEHGDWRTVHGETLEQAGYSTFQGGEPNNMTAGQFCGGMFRSGQLDDLWCDGYYSFICEKLPDSLLWVDDVEEDQEQQ